MGSFVSAPPRTEVHVVSAVYGSLSGPTTSYTRTRLWILLEQGDPAKPFARICRNDPKTGQPVYTDVGKVSSARVSRGKLELVTTADETFVLIEAPCVCGAGAAGMAGPVPGRYEAVRVRADQLDWLQVLP